MNKQTKLLNDIICGKNKNKYHFHFVGIGGVSMYSLAIYLKELGQEVSGSDTKKSKNVERLRARGIKVYKQHKKENVYNCKFVIYSYAVEGCVEVKEAERLNIPCLSRAYFLGLILKLYNTSICVAGAHGKSTTAGLIYHILKTARLNPSLHLGADLVENETSYIYENKEYFVCEACEYKDAFLNLKPNIGIILNIAPEHLDYFKCFDNVKQSFQKFANNSQMLICSSQHTFKHKNQIPFGDNGFTAKHIKLLENGNQNFDVYKNGKKYGNFTLSLVGSHNVQNSLSAIAVADVLKIDTKTIKNALSSFNGIKRRFEIINNKPLIIHDYAHHPDEISATIKSLKSFYHGEFTVVFQPHTYSRTIQLKDEFKKCFEGKDVIIYRTFSAREKYINKASAKSLANYIGEKTRYANSINCLTELLKESYQENNAIIFLGAGNIDKVAHRLKSILTCNKNV